MDSTATHDAGAMVACDHAQCLCVHPGRHRVVSTRPVAHDDTRTARVYSQLAAQGLQGTAAGELGVLSPEAFLRKPAILILDEATSALDAGNEAIILETISRLKGKMTIIVIAHRLSTIRHADQVLIMEQGKIIEYGELQQLINKMGGVFSQWLNQQAMSVPY